ncbi:hypothetical protein CKAH01_15072 [Colletotrichum kahawae]|uniref:Uncharacterized protein n=1 Tax=Colletotrichum kahawae TaxID=34407 RepID=A0AAE0D9G3_COLKA|nr:hypothetical protein CKAH01_15072 [Colletotrichum kahawae]
MDFPAILLYRTARVAVRHADGTLITTEGVNQQILYVTQNGTIGGTGQVAGYLMQQNMLSVRAEVVRYSMHPVCNHLWEISSKHWKLRVRFTSPWQPFAQLAWMTLPDGYGCTAWAYFAHAPGDVVVRMGPSGRIVGEASQTSIAGRRSPTTCSIHIDRIVRGDSIVIFLPDDPMLAPVLSLAFPPKITSWSWRAMQPTPSLVEEGPLIQQQTDVAATLFKGSFYAETPSTTAISTCSGTYLATAANPEASPQASCHNHPAPYDLTRPTQHQTPRHYRSPYIDMKPASSLKQAGQSDESPNQQPPYTADHENAAGDVDDSCIVVKPLY